MADSQRTRSATRRSMLKFAAVGAITLPAAAACSSFGDTPAESTRAAGGGTVEDRNKALITAMFDQFYGGGATGDVDDFFAAGYVEHDPAIASGRAGMVAWVDAQRALEPRPIATVKHVLAQGSLVGVHSHRSTQPSNEMTGTAVIEVFDVRQGKIVEHWAFTQDVPPSSRSGYSMFSDVYRYGAAPPVVSAEQADANKQMILKAWAGVYGSRDFSVLDRYWAPGDGYLQHNPRVPNGVGGLRGFIGSLPPSVSQNRFAIGEGDLVLTVNQSVPTSGDLNSDTVGSAVADIYRIVDGRAVEHWDVVGPVPTQSANGNSVFSRLYREP